MTLPEPDAVEPQWEACRECGGDHWTRDHWAHTTDTPTLPEPDAVEAAAGDVRRSHQPNEYDSCVTCRHEWPCDAELLAELVMTRAAIRATPSTDLLARWPLYEHREDPRCVCERCRATPSTEPRPRACVCHYADPDGVIAHLLAEYDRATPSTDLDVLDDAALAKVLTETAWAWAEYGSDEAAGTTLYPSQDAAVVGTFRAALARALGDRKGEDGGA